VLIMKLSVEEIRYYKRPHLINLKAESKLSQELALTLDGLRMDRKTKGIYFKISQEGTFHVAYHQRMKAMGKLPGVPDWCFIWPNNHLMIELKTRTGSLSKDQNFFHDEANRYDCNVIVCKTIKECLNSLYDYGFLEK